MPRDYKSRSRRDEPEHNGPSAIVWLSVGILIGLIISGVFYLRAQHKAAAGTNPVPEKHVIIPKHTASKKPATDDIQKQKQTPASTENLQTQFDFYNVLPQKTQASTVKPVPKAQPAVIIEQKEQKAPDPIQPPPATQTKAITQDIIPQKEILNIKPAQASTPTPIQKPEQKTAEKPSNYIVQIAALSKTTDADQLKAQLVLLGFDVNITAIKKNGQTLQRIWLGPFSNKNDASATQQQLQQNQITSQLLKSLA